MSTFENSFFNMQLYGNEVKKTIKYHMEAKAPGHDGLNKKSGHETMRESSPLSLSFWA